MCPFPLGLVLSGGGARGFAHMGVARALYEKGLRPDAISGVSAGAIAGAFLAAGFEPEEVYHLLEDQDIMKISSIQIPKEGLLKLTGLKKQIQKHIRYKNIEDLPVPLWVAVTNLQKARVEYHNKGPLADLVLASASIPIVFSPVEINGFQYVDGGVMDNLPIKPIRRLCQKVIAVNISPVYEELHLDSLFKVATRIFHLTVDKSTRYWSKKADLLILPPGVEHHDILRTKHIHQLYQDAYSYTTNLLIDHNSVF